MAGLSSIEQTVIKRRFNWKETDESPLTLEEVGKIIGEANSFVLGSTIDAIKRGERPGQSVTGDTQQRPD